jgi:hypothetical protein
MGLHKTVCSLAFRLGFCGLLVLSACTESHDVEATSGEEGGSGGSRAQSGSGGGGRGGSGTSTAGGNANAGGSGAAATVECGGSMCMGNAFAMACCTTDKKCGLDLSAVGFGSGCSELNAPGTANTACPSQNLMGFLMFDGCCKPDGTCGVLDTIAGLGCTSTGAAMGTRCTP